MFSHLTFDSLTLLFFGSPTSLVPMALTNHPVQYLTVNSAGGEKNCSTSFTGTKGPSFSETLLLIRFISLSTSSFICGPEKHKCQEFLMLPFCNLNMRNNPIVHLLQLEKVLIRTVASTQEIFLSGCMKKSPSTLCLCAFYNYFSH